MPFKLQALAGLRASTVCYMHACMQNGQTPLHLAACCGNLAGVETLMASGAKMDVLDDVTTLADPMDASKPHVLCCSTT